jgi:hypothetical protein
MATLNGSILSEIAWIDERTEYQSQSALIVSLDSRTVTVSTSEFVPLDQKCAITILSPSGDVLFAAQATTQHMRGHDLARHTTCQWCNRIEKDSLALLSGMGLYNRRKGNRTKVAIDAPARREMDSSQVLPVSVVDLSINGCCIKSPVAVPVGDRLAIHPVGPKHANEAIYVRIKWQQQSGEHYLLGCEFTQRNGHDKLVTYSINSSIERRSKAGASRGFTQTFLNVSQASVSVVRKAFTRPKSL